MISSKSIMEPNHTPQQTFTPQGQESPQPQSIPVAQVAPEPPRPPLAQAYDPAEDQPQPTTAAPQPHQTPSPHGPARQPAETTDEAEEPAEPETIILSWAGPEFVVTNKPAGWYALLYGFFGILIVIAIIFKQWFSIILSAVMAIAITVLANRKPKNQVYSISNYGVHIGDRAYDFDRFKAFFVSDDYGQKVLDLVPIKRFEPLVSLPVGAEQAEQAEALMAEVLPETEPHEDVVDKIFKYLRF